MRLFHYARRFPLLALAAFMIASAIQTSCGGSTETSHSYDASANDGSGDANGDAYR